jgi:hypothetical protein
MEAATHPGVLLLDQLGGNDLTNDTSAPGAQWSTVTYKEAAMSADTTGNVIDDLHFVAEVGMDADFPGKSSGSQKNYSIGAWFYFTTLPTSGNKMGLWAQWHTLGWESYRCYAHHDGTDASIRLEHSLAGGDENDTHASALQTGRWYHITVTYDDSDYSYRIRIWDDTAGAILGSDKTGTFSGVYSTYAGNGFVTGTITNNGGSQLVGYFDEMFVFNDELTTDEIDQIRGGTFGSTASGQVMPVVFN